MTFKRALTLGSMLSGLLVAPAAYADGVYLLQLGSFDEQSKAQARWQSLQAKYPDMLGDLSVRLMDVTLPPDNFKVYRTQAGALSSRADAQSICDRLAARGDECYVVETAMFAEGAVRGSVPNPPLSVEGQSVGARAAAPVSQPIATPSVAPVANVAATPVQKAEAMKREVAAEEGGFWSNLNPFSDSAAPAEPQSYPTLAATEPAPAAVTAPQPIAVIPPAEPVVAAVPVQPVASAPVLPPPPVAAPQSLQAVEQQQILAEQRAASGYRPETPNAPQPIISGSSQGVAVAEAIRVPLTEQRNAPAPAQAIGVTTPAQVSALGMPSLTVRDRTLWAQVSYFPDQQSALGFWESFRAQNPDMPPLRVRITSPYMLSNESSRVSLRVGPFAKLENVNYFCGNVNVEELSCRLVSDVGTSTSARFDRGALPDSRYAQRQQYAASPLHWVQLGTYNSAGQASAEWSRISTMSRPLLDSLQANIAPPLQGSSIQPTYRLRTGPYMSRMAADQLCAQLRSRGTRCMVVFGR